MGETITLYDAAGDPIPQSEIHPGRSSSLSLGVMCLIGIIVIWCVAAAGKHPAHIEIPTDRTDIIEWEPIQQPSQRPELRAPVGHPPLMIIVGGNTYTVHYTTAQFLTKQGKGGFTEIDTHQIWLGRDLDSPLEVRHVMLHELMHAAIAEHGDYAARAEPPATDDAFIEETSPALLGILRNNPKLLDWFQK